MEGSEAGAAFIFPEDKIRQLTKGGKGQMIFLDEGKEALVRQLISISYF